MSLLGRINDTVAAVRGERAWPVGAEVTRFESELGHRDDRFSPESYGDYIVTSNEVFSAVSLRARMVSSVPLKLYRGRGVDKTAVESGAAWRLLQHVNPHWTWARLARMDEMCMGLWGETFWAVERNRAGEPAEIWWLKPSKVVPVPDASDYLAGFLYETGHGDHLRFAPNEIVWQRYPNPIDQFSALSPLAAARLAADTGRDMMRSNRNLFTQGMNLGGVVMPHKDVTFSDEQAKDLERSLAHRFSGADKAHRWAVLRFEASFDKMAVTPKDAEFVDGLNVTARQVANAYGIPAPLLNDLEHATLANLREFQKALWEHALVPDLLLRAGEIEEQLLPMFRGMGRAGRPDHAAYDFSGVAALQESQSESWDRQRQAIEIGAVTINEWRAEHGKPSVPWGDVWWAPVNKTPVDSADAMPAQESDEARSYRRLLAAFEAPRERHLIRDGAGDIVGTRDTVVSSNGTH